MKKSVKIYNKKSQQTLDISFGVIFSIILIVFFIVIAGIVIKSFLNSKNCAQTGIFIDKLDGDVRKTWNSQFDSHTFKGSLPGSINYVCFANLSKSSRGEYRGIYSDISLYPGKNTFLYPTSKACELPANFIDHLDIEQITAKNNPNCIAVEKGIINLQVEKELNERFVNIKI